MKSGEEEVAHKGESMSLCVPLYLWLTVLIQAQMGGRSLPVTHTLMHSYTFTHTIPVRQVQRESGEINAGTPSSRLGLRQGARIGEHERLKHRHSS